MTMRWKQFFTPVQSMDAAEGHTFVKAHSPADITILDVRQPGEYENGRIPGSKLVPLPDLNDRLSELDTQKAVIAY